MIVWRRILKTGAVFPVHIHTTQYISQRFQAASIIQLRKSSTTGRQPTKGLFRFVNCCVNLPPAEVRSHPGTPIKK